MDLMSVLPLVISACALLFTAMSFRRNANHDTSAAAIERATMTADIRYIRDSIDEIKLENKSIQKDLGELTARVVEIEASTKSAHKRIDDFTKG